MDECATNRRAAGVVASAAWSSRAILGARAELFGLPAWYLEESRDARLECLQILRGFSRAGPKGIATRFDRPRTRDMAAVVEREMRNPSEWARFLFELQEDFAFRLQQHGLLRPGWWRAPQRTRKDPPIDDAFFLDVVCPHFRRFLLERAQRHGFPCDRCEYPVGTYQIIEYFFENHREGRLIWDLAFAREEHGAESHILQMLFVARRLDARFGAGSAREFYRELGRSMTGRTFWYEVFDAVRGSARKTACRPERLMRAARRVLPCPIL